MNGPPVNRWSSASHALEYLARADSIPHRVEGERELLDLLPAAPRRVLDIGSGNGRLLALVKLHHPDVDAVAIDFSETMLELLRARFSGDPAVRIVAHDLDRPLPDLGTFDAVVSSFAIHHLSHPRKRGLFEEIHRSLRADGVFCNLEHVSSPTEALHVRFLAALGKTPQEDDPSNQLLDVETQITWLRKLGFADVDCHWKWRELALLAGRKAAAG